jgi:hypothetical protein
MKIKNRILAIDAASTAMPPKPNMAAIMAIIKNIIVQRNIGSYFNQVIIKKDEKFMP